MLERFAAGWCVTDLGSSNGTWLNGDAHLVGPAAAPRRRDPRGPDAADLPRPEAAGGPQTEAEDAPPSLTARERDVLVALCRPLLTRDLFTEPASTRAIAEELVVTQAAVKQHLANLYDKFGVPARGLQPPHAAGQRRTAAGSGLDRGSARLDRSCTHRARRTAHAPWALRR